MVVNQYEMFSCRAHTLTYHVQMSVTAISTHTHARTHTVPSGSKLVTVYEENCIVICYKLFCCNRTLAHTHTTHTYKFSHHHRVRVIIHSHAQHLWHSCTYNVWIYVNGTRVYRESAVHFSLSSKSELTLFMHMTCITFLFCYTLYCRYFEHNCKCMVVMRLCCCYYYYCY